MKILLIGLFFLCCASNAVASDSVTLQWDKNPEPNITGYSVYRSNFANMSSPKRVLATADTTVLMGNVATGYYAVTASDIYGLESSFSNAIYILIPSAPTSLQLVLHSLVLR